MIHEAELQVMNRQGIHLSSANKIVATANRFEASIILHGPDVSVDAKNVMDILQLAAARGTRIRLEAEGPDAAAAADAIERLFADGFGEDEG